MRSHDHQSSTPVTDKSAPRHDMKDVLAFNRPSFSRLITYEDSGCVSRSPVKWQLVGDLISRKLNILKRKREFRKKTHPQSFRAEEDIRGAARFCWKCRGGPLVITEVNMPGDTLMFNTAVLQRFIRFCYCAARRKWGRRRLYCCFFFMRRIPLWR